MPKLIGQKISTTDLIKPVSLTMKHDFIAIVLASRKSRNKRRPELTTFDGAVLSVIVTHTNTERGYSFIGGRAIAKKLSASPSGVAKSIIKLKKIGAIIEIAGGHKNRASRLAPNWGTYLDLTAYGIGEESTAHPMAEDSDVHGIGVNLPSTAIGGNKNVKKATGKVANGTGRATLPHATPPYRGGGARSARRNWNGTSKHTKTPSAKTILDLRNKKAGK